MIFLDSSFLVAFEVDGDTNHPKAVEVMRDVVNAAYGPPVISDYVFDETATVTFLRTKELRKARLVGDTMLKAFRMLKVDDGVFRAAWQKFRSQKGPKYSFTDCTTVELMQQNSIRSIATFDTEFRSYKEFDVVGCRKPSRHRAKKAEQFRLGFEPHESLNRLLPQLSRGSSHFHLSFPFLAGRR